MFKNSPLIEAALYSATIALPCLAIAVITHIRLNKFCRTNQNETNSGVQHKVTAVKALILLLFSTSGLFIGNLISIAITYNTAISHGMTPNINTGQYDLTYGEIQAYNKKSIKETDIDIDDLKGKAVIFVRYDCPDCILLHDQLAQLDDMVFLSSRSTLGKSARELYDINLTEVPQGAYIDIDGNVTTISIVHRDENTITLDLQQIAILREMANCRTILSSE